MKRMAALLLVWGLCAAVTIGNGAASSQDAPRCRDRAATIVGTDGVDVIRGTDRNDVIAAGGGADVVDGAFGHDVVCGGAGDDDLKGGYGFDAVDGGEGDDVAGGGADWDSVTGGDGADELSGGDADDRLEGGPGLDDLDGGAGMDWALARDLQGPVAIDLDAGVIAALGDSDVLVAIENAEGSPLDDTLDGDASANLLHGGEGADMIAGRGGADVLEGGRGDDSLDGGDGADTASFELAFAPVVASLEDGTATGDGTDSFAGIEDLTGGSYDDRLIGDDGANALSGGWGYDRLEGGGGDDRFFPGFMDDAIFGGAGRDWMVYTPAAGPVDATMRRAEVMGEGIDVYDGVEVISGSRWRGDVIRGNGGANWLIGGAGTDRLYGAGGRDRLVGGPMKDLLSGGAGRDSCEDVMANRLVSCEERPRGDGPAESVITRPPYGHTFRGPTPDAIRGYVAGSRAQVEVAIVRVADFGCLGWSGAAWERASCDDRRWLEASGQGWWSYDLPRRLPEAQRYQVYARIRGSDEPSEPGRNEIFIHVLRH